MKVDGLTLLDDTKISKGETVFVGQEFPQTPTVGMTWELIDADGKTLGNYIYGLDEWLPRADPDANYSDISFSTEGYIASNSVITRYIVGKPCMLPQNFEFSISQLLEVGGGNSTFEISLLRAEVESKLADITFAGGSSRGSIVSNIAEDTMLVSGDVIVFKSKAVDADASDICVTLSTTLA